MAGRHKTAERLKATAGGILAGVGLHILFGNLNRVAAQLRHLLGIRVGEPLGTMPSVVLAASHAALAYGLDHHRFMAAFLRMLLSFWPLLLVAAGTVLLLDVFTDKVKALPGPNQNFQEKYFQGQSSGMSISLPFVRRVNERLGSGGS